MKSPYDKIFGEKPNLKYFKVFGSIFYVHILDVQKTKLGAKAKKCMFIGYDERKKSWKCMERETLKISFSRDVVFGEISSYYERKDVVAEPGLVESLPISSNSSLVTEINSSSYEQGYEEAMTQDILLWGSKKMGELALKEKMVRKQQLVTKTLLAFILVFLQDELMTMSHLVLMKLMARRIGSKLWMRRWIP